MVVSCRLACLNLNRRGLFEAGHRVRNIEFFKLLNLLRAEIQRKRGNRIVQVMQLGRAANRRGNRLLLQHPR